MAKKKSINEKDIMSMYMKYVLEQDKKPHTVYLFSKENKINEQDFYKYFASFEVLEKYIFNAFFENTLHVLEKSEDYKSFDDRNKLLSFYFTFFENLTANRSYVMFSLEQNKHSLKGLQKLSKLKQSFTGYINTLDIEMLDIQLKQINQIQKKGLQESAWIQLLLTLRFWMDDSSPSFEKTDIFIEKSVNTSFDILQMTPLKSVIDLGKFLFKEKASTNS
ncbi:TetR family transcriptional regulator C-terminal domain-containing protein [Xanthomarina sp. F2636L]|uniref:TetR family transcriptional regulator C-terminal domain-containing protein n=1 Tax=Xanthomarina sp. F2636L TaxID=2996018 RepID=UPI00225DFB5F|nr:TetR family transcriptional regulator C-terminal domain-containing protein [Xanthomarina sp. F2636L]MCX7550323.1 TetR family transcriptional regulator C-terminal domain-containing protein [Xanthomarina sp. F2636L]